MKSTAYSEKKKNAIPPPKMPIHTTICLILDIIIKLKNRLLNLLNQKNHDFIITDCIRNFGDIK